MQNSQRPLIIAHRGSSAHAPENTFAAFKKAIEEGADGIEFDVRLSKNGIPVVFHDRTLTRTANRDGEVAGYTAAELSRMDNGSWFNTAYPKQASDEFGKQTVKTLAETLAFIGDFKGRIFVELKCSEANVEKLSKAVCEVVKGSAVRSQIIIKSFKLAVIPFIKSNCPDVRTAALFAPKIMTILRKEKYLVNIALEFGADELSVHYSLATRKLMKKAKEADLPVAIWTADHPRWVKRGAKLGIQSIITNNPSRLLEKRSELIKA